MTKIQFKNLPDTTTPVSAENLNAIQTNTESAINEASTTASTNLTNATKGYQTSTTGAEHEITDSAGANGKLNIESGKTEQAESTIASENILDTSVINSQTKSGVTITRNDNGTFTLNGTASADIEVMANLIKPFTNSTDYKLSMAKLSGTLSNGRINVSIRTETENNNANLNDTTDYATAGLNKTDEYKYMRLFIASGTVLTNYNFYVQIVLRTTGNTYIPFVPDSPSPDYPQDIVSIGSNINLFDKNNAINGYRLGPDGKGASDANYYVSPFIKVEPNTQYTKNSPIVDAYHRFAFYTTNSDTSVISVLDSSNTAVTPSNCQYIRFCGLKTEVDTAKLEKGSVATSYSPYNRGSIGFKVRNKNIWGGFSAPYTRSVYGVTFVTNIDGTISAKGTASSATQSTTTSEAISNGIYSTLTPGTYTFSCLDVETGKTIQILDENNTLLGTITNASQPVTITLTETKKVYARVNIGGGNSVDKTFHIQAEKGSTETSYVTHQEQTINVPMPEGMELCKRNDYIDKPIKINNQWNKNQVINEIILNGTENWVYQSANNRFVLTSATTALSNARNLSLCSHFIYGSTDDNDLRFSITTDNSLLIRYDAMNGDATAFKTWLGQQYSNGNPVKIKYVSSTSINVPITNADTLEGLYQIEHILMYEGYTLIECIDEVKPDTHVEYLYNNEVNNTFGGIIAELNNDIHKLGGYIYEKTGTSSTGCSYSIRYSIIGKVCTAMIDFTLPSNYTLGGIVIDNNILPAPMGYNNVGTPAVLNLRSGTNGEFYKAYLNIYGGISSYKSDVVVNARYQGSISYLVE